MSEKTYQRQLATQAFVTSECRKNRGDGGAWDEAVRRLKAEYDEIVKGWEDEPEQPVLVLTLYCDRPVEDQVPPVPQLFAGSPDCQPTPELLGEEEGEKRVVFQYHPECLEGENVREFHPEIVGAATGALRTMLDPETDARAHRDADILASCAVSEALKALVAVASLNQTESPGNSGGDRDWQYELHEEECAHGSTLMLVDRLAGLLRRITMHPKKTHPGRPAVSFEHLNAEILDEVREELEIAAQAPKRPSSNQPGNSGRVEEEGDEALIARVRERFNPTRAFFDIGDGQTQEVDWDSVIGNVLHHAGALPCKKGDGA